MFLRHIILTCCIYGFLVASSLQSQEQISLGIFYENSGLGGQWLEFTKGKFFKDDWSDSDWLSRKSRKNKKPNGNYQVRQDTLIIHTLETAEVDTFLIREFKNTCRYIVEHNSIDTYTSHINQLKQYLKSISLEQIEGDDKTIFCNMASEQSKIYFQRIE